MFSLPDIGPFLFWRIIRGVMPVLTILTDVLLVVLIIELWIVGNTLLEALKAIGEILEGLTELIRNTNRP